MERLDLDPAYQQRMATRERERQHLVFEHQQAAAPVVDELRNAGFEIENIGDLRQIARSRRTFSAALPILTSWLPRVAHPGVKAEIVQILASKWASDAVPALVAEFLATPVDQDFNLKWAIGNALAEAADSRAYDSIAGLVGDRSHGRAREMLPLALARTGNPAVVGVLVELLNDEEVAGHVIIALGRMRAIGTRSAITPFVDHRKGWIRREAKRTLAKFDRSAGDEPRVN